MRRKSWKIERDTDDTITITIYAPLGEELRLDAKSALLIAKEIEDMALEIIHEYPLVVARHGHKA